MKSNYLKIGKGLIHTIETALEHNNFFGTFLYVADPVVDKLYGDLVKQQLTNKGKVKVEIVEHNTISYAMSIAERCIATDIDCIIGLGGGTTLDVCKYASYISKTPYLSIPTTASNDGLVSPIAVLKREDGLPKSLGAKIPTMTIIDTEIIAAGPLQNIKAGIGDTISNKMALKDWDFAVSKGKDSMNTYAYLMSKNSLDVLMNTSHQTICPEFIEVLVNSLVLSGIAMDFAGTSRPVSGSEHCFSHALDFYSDTKNLHGIQVALGTISMLKLINEPYDDVLAYLKKFDVNVNPIHLGITENVFIKCMQYASSMRKGRYTHLDDIDLNEERLKHLYHELVEEL